MGSLSESHESTGLPAACDGVALRAMFRTEQLLAALGFAGLFEITDGVPVGEQITSLSFAQRRQLDHRRARRLLHRWRVVSHQRGQERGSRVAVHAPCQVRADSSALPVDAVAAQAQFGCERVGAAPGVGFENREACATSIAMLPRIGGIRISSPVFYSSAAPVPYIFQGQQEARRRCFRRFERTTATRYHQGRALQSK